MAAIMATIAIILRSIASAPVGGPGGASGRGSATRAAYHSTAPRTSRRKTAVISAGRLVTMQWERQASSGRGNRVFGIGDRARNRDRRAGLDDDLATGVDVEWEAVHGPRGGALNDLPVAVVDRAVAWALEAAFIGKR